MYGTLAGALAGRKVPFDRASYTATVDGRIAGVGKTIKITDITMHYDVTVPAESREAAERALAVHPAGCPAHESVKGAIAVRWDAKLRVGDQVIALRSEPAPITGGGA
jgi:uncharacterized OsmC-like protein